jgi:hypothetical protein
MQKSNLNEPPEGIILTISRQMYADKGYLNWRRNFLMAMNKYEEGDGYYYWLRVSCRPTMDSSLLYVYLCVGNKLRYRGFYGGVRETPEGFKQFDDGRIIRGRFWVLIAGPVELAPRPHPPKQGFRGFRYTQKIW